MLVKRLGPGAAVAIDRIFGFLLLAIAVQLVWNGVADFKGLDRVARTHLSAPGTAVIASRYFESILKYDDGVVPSAFLNIEMNALGVL